MKKILLAGLAIAGLTVTTMNSRANGLSFSILLGHDHHYCAPPVVVAPPPVIVHPAPVCGIVAPPVHVYGHGHGYRHDHHYTVRERRHDGVIRIMGTGLMPVGMSKGIQPIGAMGEQSASVTAARTK